MSQHPRYTFELTLQCDSGGTKEHLIAWLVGQGIDSFVEGCIDGLDINPDYGTDEPDSYESMGGEAAAISIYKYDREFLEDLSGQVGVQFSSRVDRQIKAELTADWMEGWKESFRPISTARFYVYPPWEKDQSSDDQFPICLEPGMAFGTGQHATTRLCLAAIEQHVGLCGLRVADVGTGSGILAVAAAKLGARVTATDIDVDAVKAASENARINHVEYSTELGSVPAGRYDLVVANILAVVLLKLLPGLINSVASGGTMLLSGVLAEESAVMEEALGVHEFKLMSTSLQDEWAALVFEREA